jgi:catechol 2,3-dioxygenase-like lactoylglutathione lyase family enzyme
VPRRSHAPLLKSSPRALSLNFWPALADGREQALLDTLFIQLLERAYALFEPQAGFGIVVRPKQRMSVYFRDPDGHLLEIATPGLWKGY